MRNFTKTLLLILGLSLTSIVNAQIKLSSFPSASATIFLDFDGHHVQYPYWNNSLPFECASAEFNDEKITEIFHRVAEDFRPFDVNITTDSSVFINAPLNMRMRVIITPTSAWSPGVGGIAYIGSFSWGDDAPIFVFSDRLSNNSKYIAECISHETGHSIGLSHQSTYNENCELVEVYAMGNGSGETGWAPVMGNSYYRNMTGWNEGPTPYGCALVQDNLTIITTINGFGYRTDDYHDVADEYAHIVDHTFSVDGVISTNTDKDAFRYVVEQTGNIHIEAKPFGLNNSSNGANLDIKMKIADADGNTIAVYNPEDRMNVVLDTILNSGTYYFIISGDGNSNISNYGSLGSYTLTVARGALPIRDIRLTGNVYNKAHNLQWEVIADEEVVEQVIEYSTNGLEFNTLAVVDKDQRSFSYVPQHTGNLMYRIRITTSIDQMGYSNIFVLQSNIKTKLATVQSAVRDLMTIQSIEDFKYMLYDMNGRLMRSGQGLAGVTHINLASLPAGVYVLKMFSQNFRQVERIVKQ